MLAIRTLRPFTERIPLAWSIGSKAKLINPIPDNQTLPIDEYFLFGILRGSGDMFKRLLKNKITFYYADHAYLYNQKFQKNFCYRITKNWHCNFNISDRPSDRYEMFKSQELMDWKKNSQGHILICPPSFYIQVFNNQFNWLNNTISILKKFTKKKILIREKKDTEQLFKMAGIKYQKFSEEYSTESLEKDITNSFCIVTYNSMVAIEALIRGIPVFTNSKFSVAYNMSNNNFEEIEYPFFPNNRQEFLNHLAYSQFTIEEMQSGKAYEILKD